eukprot:jgi/Psemu1/282942/fgenesh1_pg.17_\
MIRRKRSLPRSSQSCAQQQQQRKGRIRNSRYYPALAILLVMAFHTITVRITTLDLPAILTSAGSLLCKAADTVLPRLQQQWERQWELKWQRQWQPPPAVGAELGRSSGGGSGGGSRGGGGSGSRGGSRDPPKKEPEESSYAASSRSESAGAFGTSSFRPYGGTSTTTSSATTTNHLLATAPAAILRRTLVVLLLVEALDRAGILCVFRDKASRMAGGLRAAWCHRVVPALKKPLVSAIAADVGGQWPRQQ